MCSIVLNRLHVIQNLTANLWSLPISQSLGFILISILGIEILVSILFVCINRVSHCYHFSLWGIVGFINVLGFQSYVEFSLLGFQLFLPRYTHCGSSCVCWLASDHTAVGSSKGTVWFLLLYLTTATKTC